MTKTENAERARRAARIQLGLLGRDSIMSGTINERPTTARGAAHEPKQPTGISKRVAPLIPLPMPVENAATIWDDILTLVRYMMLDRGLECVADPEDPERELVAEAIAIVQAEMAAEAEVAAAAEIAAKAARKAAHDLKRRQALARVERERAAMKAAQAQAHAQERAAVKAAKLIVHRAEVAERRRLRRIAKAAARTAAREAENESKSLQPPDLASFPGEAGPMDPAPADRTHDLGKPFVDESRTELCSGDGTDPNG